MTLGGFDSQDCFLWSYLVQKMPFGNGPPGEGSLGLGLETKSLWICSEVLSSQFYLVPMELSEVAQWPQVVPA